eukprot:CAMPEP_0196585030 /NCGR_PEP_ID=MMETSP1081-20130531/49344_1 /TAXON_ID=36882 /ORGANISM="Pyramimonas amylifera, Strain CCMP720" /LENGTH=128 /DNA_ID=CAMNT_0041906441 /DNA_START=238 /DNA_END=621 /DNA_ORIENTATION=+
MNTSNGPGNRRDDTESKASSNDCPICNIKEVRSFPESLAGTIIRPHEGSQRESQPDGHHVAMWRGFEQLQSEPHQPRGQHNTQHQLPVAHLTVSVPFSEDVGKLKETSAGHDPWQHSGPSPEVPGPLP